MRVKRYEAPTLQEALLHVKRDLGSDAVILQTRKFNRGGMFGMFGRNMVEVLAATDIETAGNTNKKISTQKAQATTRPSVKEAGRASSASADMNLNQELREVKAALQTLLEKQKMQNQEEAAEPYPRLFGDIYLRLIENDFDNTIAQDIIRSIDESITEENKEDEKAVKAALDRQLRRLIKTSGAIELSGQESKTIAFIGPTGVGKTTTIAKLATIISLQKRMKVGIITADTYRIAAVEQIKTYSEIINVPIKVVYTAEDMKRAVDYFSDRDLILVDTAGRSHFDKGKISEVRDLLAVCYPLEIHLVIAAQTRYKDMIDIAEKFRPLAYNHLIFTKLDETSTYGNLINLIAKCNVGVSYLCYGQNVPGEIMPANTDFMLKILLGKSIRQALGEKRES